MDVDIGPRVREIREQRGLTQSALADLAGLSLAMVSAVEQGRLGVSLATACAIAAALGVTVDDLCRPAATASKRGRGRPKKQ